ncbi:hypothetical protein E2542_SST25241 [Spatholobus suberectus]|nr:hypothetical protein E2542_SST25241 [Spatholobus suberectus]
MNPGRESQFRQRQERKVCFCSSSSDHRARAALRQCWHNRATLEPMRRRRNVVLWRRFAKVICNKDERKLRTVGKRRTRVWGRGDGDGADRSAMETHQRVMTHRAGVAVTRISLLAICAMATLFCTQWRNLCVL